MIPKRIHYCWFGRGEKPKLAKKCIASWKRYCPDYEIIEWNEDNYNLDSNKYTRYCYDNKKWAFLSDYVRLDVVSKHGGLYFDTDVELLKNINELLEYEAFYGFENETSIATGLGFGSEAQHPTIIAMKKMYEDIWLNREKSIELLGCPILNTRALLGLGIVLNGRRQSICGAEIFPVEYFNPYDDSTGILNKTKNTISIHWYSKSWMSKSTILRSKLTKPFHRLFGNNCFDWLKRIIK